MADTTPRLPVTAEANDYAPYSFLAVLAVGVAGLFVVVMLLLGISSWLGGQKLFEPELLIMPLVAGILAFAAARQIRNSEGTRIGYPLCKWAGRIALVGGLGYATYLFAISWTTDLEANTAFEAWSQSFSKIDPVDPKNVELLTAFHATLSPEKQATLTPNDTVKLYGQFRTQILAFRQSDLVRIAARNPGNIKFEFVGMEDWNNDKAGALTCRLTVKAIVPEGEYVMSLPMVKQTVKGRSEPVWQVQPPQNESTSFTKSAKFSDYGERIRDLELAAQQLVYSNFLVAANERSSSPILFEEFGKPTPNPQSTLGRLRAQAAVRGPLFDPVDGYAALSKQVFTPLEKGDPVREEEQRKQFLRAWRDGFIGVPGQILNRSPDVAPIFVPGEKAWEIRVPIELQTTQNDRSQSAARGVVVCRLDDSATLEELKTLRANPGPLHDAKQRTNPLKPVPWRVVRIESEMKVETAPRGPGPQD